MQVRSLFSFNRRRALNNKITIVLNKTVKQQQQNKAKGKRRNAVTPASIQLSHTERKGTQSTLIDVSTLTRKITSSQLPGSL